MSKDLQVSFVLRDNYPTRNGNIGGFYFNDGVAVVPSAIASQAEKFLCGYYGCSRHEGVFVPKKKIVEKKAASRRAVTGAKVAKPDKSIG